MEPYPTEHLEVESKVTKSSSVWHSVTPFSKYAAMLLFILMPFIGGYIGYHYASEKVVDEIVFTEADTTGISSGNLPTLAVTQNYCVRVNPNESLSLYSSVRNELISQYPNHDLEKLVRDGYECLLFDGSYLALIPFVERTGKAHIIWGQFFVEYETDGTITHVSEPFETSPGEMFIAEMRSEYYNHIRFITNSVDPCYSAYQVYTYNLESKELAEERYGGEDAECMERFRNSAPFQNTENNPEILSQIQNLDKTKNWEVENVEEYDLSGEQMSGIIENGTKLTTIVSVPNGNATLVEGMYHQDFITSFRELFGDLYEPVDYYQGKPTSDGVLLQNDAGHIVGIQITVGMRQATENEEGDMFGNVPESIHYKVFVGSDS